MLPLTRLSRSLVCSPFAPAGKRWSDYTDYVGGWSQRSGKHVPAFVRSVPLGTFTPLTVQVALLQTQCGVNFPVPVHTTCTDPCVTLSQRLQVN